MTESIEAPFSNLGLRPALSTNLVTLGYERLTPIQEQSLPFLLKRVDLIAQSKTGSGKTVAFGLSILNHLNVRHFAIQALVLCPTRELAEQVSQALRQLARQMPNVKILNLSGGMPMTPQLDSLRHATHIIVGTPGRVQKHLDKGSLSLEKLETLILDEADRMLDMGFYEEIEAIIQACPTPRQTLLFSATYPPEIKKLASKFMLHPQKITIQDEQVILDIEQQFYEVDHPKHKFALLKSLLFHHKPSSTLIFCNTKEQTVQLAKLLTDVGFSTLALNGDMEQVDRDLAMIRFGNKSCSILIATDVAARGLDIKALPAVINYDLAYDLDVHTHRIGRTGRAGQKGLALSITTPADGERLALIETELGQPLNWGDIASLNTSDTSILRPEVITLCISAGKKDKIRPGDILGALTKEAGLAGSMIEKIDITPLYSYVAIHNTQVDKAYKHFQNGKLKGRKVVVKKLVK